MVTFTIGELVGLALPASVAVLALMWWAYERGRLKAITEIVAGVELQKLRRDVIREALVPRDVIVDRKETR